MRVAAGVDSGAVVPYAKNVRLLIFVVLTSMFLFGASVTSIAQESEPIIKFERSQPRGIEACALDYSITIFADGRVIYSGRENVAVLGMQHAQIGNAAVKQLVNRFETARFLEMKAVEMNRETGMTIHDCRQDQEWLKRYGLADLCVGKEKVERWERLRNEHGPGDMLYFRSGDKSNALRTWEVSLGVDVHAKLAGEVHRIVGIDKWTQPSPCRRT